MDVHSKKFAHLEILVLLLEATSVDSARKKLRMLKPSPFDPNRRFHLERLGSGQVGVGWAWGGWDRPDLVGVVVGSTPCQVGWGRVGVWVESGTGRGRVGVDSVSSRAGSSWGLGRVGTGRGRV